MAAISEQRASPSRARRASFSDVVEEVMLARAQARKWRNLARYHDWPKQIRKAKPVVRRRDRLLSGLLCCGSQYAAAAQSGDGKWGRRMVRLSISCWKMGAPEPHLNYSLIMAAAHVQSPLCLLPPKILWFTLRQ